MDYLLTFLEGVISFISPCMLPMLPIYISYFAGGGERKVIPRAISFVAGFTVVFCLLGLFAGTLGGLLLRYKTAVNIICGIIVVILGLSFMEVIRIPFFKGGKGGYEIKSIFSAFVFGMIFSVSLTPCVGVFLGSALMLASTSGTAAKGVLLLLFYSLGIGVPFVFSAVLIDKLKGIFNIIKKNYRVINTVCGIFLIIIGILMMSGMLGRVLGFLGGNI